MLAVALVATFSFAAYNFYQSGPYIQRLLSAK